MNMELGEPRIAGDRSSQLEKFVCDGNEVVQFKLVRTAADLEDSDSPWAFSPDMCHQIFSQTESIFGYENLKIKMYFTAGSLNPYLGIQYKSRVSRALADGVDPDDIKEQLGGVLRTTYTSNLDDFSADVERSQTNFKPYGELINSFTIEPRHIASEKKGKPGMNGHTDGVKNGSSAPKTYEIYYCDASVPKFKEYLEKMETFILWFVDAATFVDPDDERWKFFVMFEKYKSSDGNTLYSFVGYSSVYSFYCYPEMIRPRVAQMLILPPFQRQGLAVELLSTVYTTYRNKTNVKEITVEDPSDDFERLRDFVDARDCSKLSSYSNEKLKQGFSAEMAEEAKKTLKMTNRQSKRVYEMLRLRVTNVHNEKELKEYRLDVKRRLNIPYQKQQSDINRMVRRKFHCTELQTQAQLDDASRKTELESNFQLLYSHYQYVVNRLERDC